MITIGQLAAYAGVTIKAVRHYHDRGLLPEPPRDASGYRRYTAQHAIDLVKIRTLAEAGVPLARIKELLGADPARFQAAIGDIDRALRERAMDLQRTRERLAQLRGGDRLFVSPEVAALLDSLREIGVSPRTVRVERDIWILLQSVSPEQAAVWIADKSASISDPEFRAIYLEYDQAFDWSPEDPRLQLLAERTRRWLAGRSRQQQAARRVDGPARAQADGPARPQAGAPVGAPQVRGTGEAQAGTSAGAPEARGPTGEATAPARPDAGIARLIATSPGASSPAWDRLAEIAKKLAEESGAARGNSAPGDS